MTPTTDQDLTSLLRALADAHGRSVQRIAREWLAKGQLAPTLGEIDDSERFASSLAILKPFLAQIWDDGLSVGLDYDVRVRNGYEPKTNPYKDS